MPTRKFTHTKICTSGVNCAACRDTSDEGRQWRASLGKVFALPQAKVDFECPHGRPWGYAKAKPLRLFPGPGDALAGLIKVVTLGRVKMCPSCGSRRKTMNEWRWRGCLRHPVRLVRLFTSP